MLIIVGFAKIREGIRERKGGKRMRTMVPDVLEALEELLSPTRLTAGITTLIIYILKRSSLNGVLIILPQQRMLATA